MTPTSWAKNLSMWSDLTLGSSFKVKRWLIGFGELSFWWIQFASLSDALGLVIYLFLLKYAVLAAFLAVIKPTPRTKYF